jgi:hypothetical protein
MTISIETPSRRAALGALASIPALALPSVAMAAPAALAALPPAGARAAARGGRAH